MSARWIYPETAQPTRRLLTALLWLFGAVVAYPYLPGSQSDAFKGVSVFLGLMVTIGSSGLVTQIMSGFMITYSRALRMGDFVKIGDVEGNVTHLGVLSTKIKTLRNEDVTIPNAVVVAQTTTDYYTVRRQRRRVHVDVGDHRLRHAVAPGACAAARWRPNEPRAFATSRSRWCCRRGSRTST